MDIRNLWGETTPIRGEERVPYRVPEFQCPLNSSRIASLEFQLTSPTLRIINQIRSAFDGLELASHHICSGETSLSMYSEDPFT